MRDITAAITRYTEEYLANDMEHFIVSIERNKDGRKYSVIVDGDKGASIDFCALLSRHISRKIDEEMGEDTPAFTFEVASPGVDRPLMQERQYPKHIGRSIKFEKDGKTVTGKLKNVEGGKITVDVETKEKDKKKVQLSEQTFNISEIKEPKIIVSFK